jgi:hypothetical protein
MMMSLLWAGPAHAEPEPKAATPAPVPVARPATTVEATGDGASDVKSAAPPPSETAEAVVPAVQTQPAAPDLSVVRQELQSVLDELIQARSRVSVLGKALFKTSLDVNVVRRADEQRLVHIVLSLDGIAVHDSDGKNLSRDEAQLFHGYAAPGMHELTIETTEEARANSAYRHTRSERFRFEVRRDTHTKVEIVLRDASDLAEELPQGDEGELDVRTLVRVEAEEIERK